MIFLNLKVDNLYMFKDAEFDFTYAKKLKNSTIPSEHLHEFPNIKYKKINIFMGANASGKTTIGKIMCNLQNFMNGKDLGLSIADAIFDKKKYARISVIYALPLQKTLNKLILKIDTNGLIYEECKSVKLYKTLSYGKLVEKLEKSEYEFLYSTDNNHDITNPGFKSLANVFGKKIDGGSVNWSYLFTEINNSPNTEKTIKIELFQRILQTFDSSIIKISKVKESTENKYIIKFINKQELDINFDNLNLHNEKYNRLSSGTRQAVEVAGLIYRIIESNAGIGTFFLDEKLSYSHSELEIAIINLIINKLGKDTQFFYTTHNYDILDMNLPTHSWTFFTNDKFAKIIHPEKLGYSKNDRTLLSLVKNDVFNNIPSTENIDELAYE